MKASQNKNLLLSGCSEYDIICTGAVGSHAFFEVYVPFHDRIINITHPSKQKTLSKQAGGSFRSIQNT